ncbi:penicillin-binding protein 1C [Roseibium algae]|uniref:peptidoglycan glycosyltransferase n=1 Tax=Roseibium algae TaxID=3123038 RepID=A0ABU8TJ18_9HYPH
MRFSAKGILPFAFAGVMGFMIVAAVGGITVWSDYANLPRAERPEALSLSHVVLDRHGQLLRAFTSADDKWRLPVKLGDIDPLYLQMLLAYEDKRFKTHSGVDWSAMARASLQMLSSGQIVSGGSTLTMQVARLLEERPTRSLSAKYQQILEAFRLEEDLTKDEILTLYALRAPFGGNLEGIRAASLVWFGKEPKRLTPAEVALLVALPQSPESRRPDRHPASAERARNRVLARAVSAGVLSEDDARGARLEKIPEIRRDMPFLAAHAARQAVTDDADQSIHSLTLDHDLQAALEQLVRERTPAIGLRASAAIIVADHQSGEILASVGSTGLMDEARFGHLDMTKATRSPGSTLKPLIYGLAFEQGIAHPESFIDDRPIDIGGYKPTNFDRAYQGRVSVRDALQLSLNTPAIQLLEAVGPAKLVARLKRSGGRPVFSGHQAAGLAIGLGGLGLSLLDLTQLYAGLANQGRAVHLYIKGPDGELRSDLSMGKSVGLRSSSKVLDEIAAWHVSDILSGLPQPQSAGTAHIAYKTGTAYGYRDAWAIGFDGRHVIGVWTGRADGTPVPGMTGTKTAVPILFEAFQRLKQAPDPLPSSPKGTLKVSGAELPLPLRAARVSDGGGENGQMPLSIIYPPQDGIVELGFSEEGALQPLVVKLQGGQRPYSWFVNGTPEQSSTFAMQLHWQPDGPGMAQVTVVDSVGESQSVELFLR